MIIHDTVCIYQGFGHLHGKADEQIAKDVADHLLKHYPGYLWFVNCSVKAGVVTILCGDFYSNYGYKILLKDIENDPSMKVVMRAGGEILDRYGLRRGAKTESSLRDLKMVAGRAAFDYNEMIGENDIPKRFKKMLEKARK